MGETHLLLALHNHQPVGNFENIFREAFEKCYDPFIKFLEEHPFIRVSLHYSGCLFDWLEAREKQFIKRLERLISHGQVEMMGGGYYEPILPIIPERDAIDQLRFMNQYLKKRFGKAPKGFWLAERVWEQKLPRLAGEADLHYITVDDTHFALAGLAESQIKNVFITEEEGHTLYLFPIPKTLRYQIPFREPSETIQYLREISSPSDQNTITTYADDGEKFGLWPGTYQWVYRDGWLERFAKSLEENKVWLKLKTFGEVLDAQKGKPCKKVYLPSASYEEMTEWAQDPEKAYEFARLKRELESSGLWRQTRVFFQGGTFKNFLAKYPEGNWMRSKAEWVSRKIQGIKSPALKKKAQQELWQGQCNCPYWHGVFGGLYLHHLRRSTYEHLIRAEKLCKASSHAIQIAEDDLNHDGANEVVMNTPSFSLYFMPHRGGSLVELDFIPENINLLDTLTRREEAYHRDLVEKKEGGEDQKKSIHDLEKSVSAEVLERLAFDSHDRLSFVDQFLPLGTDQNGYWKNRFQALVKDPTSIAFSHRLKKGKIYLESSNHTFSIQKSLEIKGGARLFLEWKIANESKDRIDCLWGTEWNFTFYDKAKDLQGLSRIEIQDGWSPVQVIFEGEKPFNYWQFPIETVAQTEKDFRLIHQGIATFPHWRLTLSPGAAFYCSLVVSFKSRR